MEFGASADRISPAISKAVTVVTPGTQSRDVALTSFRVTSHPPLARLPPSSPHCAHACASKKSNEHATRACQHAMKENSQPTGMRTVLSPAPAMARRSCSVIQVSQCRSSSVRFSLVNSA